MNCDSAARQMMDAARIDTKPFFECNGKLLSRFSEIKFSSLRENEVKLLVDDLNNSCADTIQHWVNILVKRVKDDLKTEA